MGMSNDFEDAIKFGATEYVLVQLYLVQENKLNQKK